MKNIIILLLATILFSSCGGSKYIIPLEPNQSFTEENIKTQGIKPETMQNVYVTFSSSGSLFKNPQEENFQDVNGGVVFLTDKLSGEELIIPKEETITYYSGPKKGKKVILKNGNFLMQDFLIPIRAIETDLLGNYKYVFIELGNDSISDIFALEPIRVQFQSSVGVNGLKQLRSRTRTNQNYQTRFAFEALRFESGMKLESIFQVQKNDNLIFFVDRGERYYILIGNSGQQWYVNQNMLNNYLDEFYLIRRTDNQKERSIAKSKKIGQ